jgi:hypothetical protein
VALREDVARALPRFELAAVNIMTGLQGHDLEQDLSGDGSTA